MQSVPLYIALRRARAELESGIVLQRYWQVWTTEPPSPQLQVLLDRAWQGKYIFLYVR